ncbi:MAG: hypothetical protein IKI75_00575 [Lachnospiraceae bacterium]|nr:hypothetical protein [Lachnospiraceae bacterium]
MEPSPMGILFLIFAGTLVLFSGLMVISKDFADFLLYRVHDRKKLTKAFRIKMSKHICVFAIGPALGGLAGFTGSDAVCGIVTLVASIICLILSVKLVK